MDIIAANDGTPPLTYTHFCHVTDSLGPPPHPAPTVDLKGVPMAELTDEVLANMNVFEKVPTQEQLGFVKTVEQKVYKVGQLAFWDDILLGRHVVHWNGMWTVSRAHLIISNTGIVNYSPDQYFAHWDNVDSICHIGTVKSTLEW